MSDAHLLFGVRHDLFDEQEARRSRNYTHDPIVSEMAMFRNGYVVSELPKIHSECVS